MRFRNFIVSFLVIVISLQSQSFAFGNADQQTLDNILLKLERLNTDLNILQKQFYRNGEQYLQPKEQEDISPKFQVSIQNLEEKLRNLTGLVEQLQFNIHTQQKALDKMQLDVEERIAELSKLDKNTKVALTVESDVSETENASVKGPRKLAFLKDTNSLEASVMPSELATTRDMIASKQFDTAAGILHKYVVDEDNQANNKIIAFHQLGNIYKEQELFDKAAVNYLKAYKADPEGVSAAINVLDLAYALNKLGKYSESCNMLGKVKFGKVEANEELVRQAENNYEKFGCR